MRVCVCVCICSWCVVPFSALRCNPTFSQLLNYSIAFRGVHSHFQFACSFPPFPRFSVSHLRLRLPSHFTSASPRSLLVHLTIYMSVSVSPAFSRSINFMAVVAPSLLAPKQLHRQLLCSVSCSKICCMCFPLPSPLLLSSLLLCFLLCVLVALSAGVAAAGHDVKGTN